MGLASTRRHRTTTRPSDALKEKNVQISCILTPIHPDDVNWEDMCTFCDAVKKTTAEFYQLRDPAGPGEGGHLSEQECAAYHQAPTKLIPFWESVIKPCTD
jgi:hypothetical protein